ncbi:sodium:solute symporter family protein [Falsiroseomonas selenitidurans]|uniref:Cation acetate symporter n=1 Tax=Falsiroseomonas selenitidurans TaxID=2716335 RepID=A0ABX1EBY6_9PROT|nr:sodium:solute symporter family protein [Falsiroseomonas selenitidurans]NKC33007.1 cation acetate symporter [Falsiroseomonas selenitidurans]
MSDSPKAQSGDFLSNLGKIYGWYTGGFAAFVLVLAVLEQVGVPNRIIGYLFVFLTIGVYALIGYLSRTAQVSEYYVAGRRVPALYNGMATGSDWMSAASFIGMAGTLYLQGYDGLAFVLGWTGGYVLVAILLAPYLRKFGAYTVPDFLGARYGGNLARLAGVIVLMSASFTYVVAQIFGTGIIASRFLGISFELSVFVGLAGILVCSMLGGMRAVTWTQVAQYIILIIAYLLPVVLLSAKVTGVPVPQLMYGQALEQIEALRATKEALAGAPSHITPFINSDPINFFGLIFCLMLGTASLPHILMRYFTTPSVRDARQSVAWSLFFIFLLYFTAPAYAAFAKLEVFTNVIGAPIASLPEWVSIWTNIGLVRVTDANADGILQFREFVINADAIVLATPEIAGLPYVIAGLVAAGGLAAALSTADGLLLAIANALSHDIYYRMIDPQADSKRRLVVARVLLIVVALVAAWVASTRPAGILAMVAWAFSIAASGLFPALVMGVWWKRTTSAGAVAGMVVGYGVCLFYLIGTQYMGMPLWFGIRNISCGLFGIPAAFLTTFVVSLMTQAPSQAMQDFIDSIRTPRGGVRMVSGEKVLD